MKLSLFARLWQSLKMVFWDKVSTAFSSSNHDLCLVTISPRLLARIANKINVDKVWMERYVNGRGIATWVTRANNQIILVYAGALFTHLERAHKKNAEKMKVIPEQFLLGEKTPDVQLSNKAKIDIN